MSAWEFITEAEARRPEISLRQLNDLKHEVRARAASNARRDRLVRAMYANPAREHQRIELEKARLELEQQKAEVAATKAEARAETSETISGMAKAGTKADQQRRSKVAGMARAEMRQAPRARFRSCRDQPESSRPPSTTRLAPVT